jgi:hypothetical protein
MKKSRFTDSQIIAVLKQAEAGAPVPELCREHGISSATFGSEQSRTAEQGQVLRYPHVLASNISNLHCC